jgi:4-diphosphocytidyl-2-C-methyl-D-erythritol kinase
MVTPSGPPTSTTSGRNIKPLDTLHDVLAPAKLNLFLHIVGRRADGMHFLQSLFVLIDWCDTLHFTRRDDGVLTRRDLSAALPDDDLSLRAARALQAATGTPHGVDIAIDKQVPWGAGLGGGSSDAATTLIALNRLWGLGQTRAQLAAIAATLGADVPFFIGGAPSSGGAIVEGIGERLTPVHLPAQRFAVVKPPTALATADVFRHPAVVRNTPEKSAAAILAGFVAKAPNAFEHGEATTGGNDLQLAAMALCPEVTAALDILQRQFGHARMSGSGSAVFARIGDKDDTTDAWLATSLARQLPQGWTSRVCRSLPKHPLDTWLG